MHNFLGDGMPTRRMFWTEIGAIWTQQFVGQYPPRLRHGVMSFRDGFLRRRTFIDKGGIFPGPVEDHSVLSVFLPLIVFGGRFVYDDLGPCTSSVATTCVPCRVSRSGLCNSWVPGDWDVFFGEFMPGASYDAEPISESIRAILFSLWLGDMLGNWILTILFSLWLGGMLGNWSLQDGESWPERTVCLQALLSLMTAAKTY